MVGNFVVIKDSSARKVDHSWTCICTKEGESFTEINQLATYEIKQRHLKRAGNVRRQGICLLKYSSTRKMDHSLILKSFHKLLVKEGCLQSDMFASAK